MRQIVHAFAQSLNIEARTAHGYDSIVTGKKPVEQSQRLHFEFAAAEILGYVVCGYKMMLGGQPTARP